MDLKNKDEVPRCEGVILSPSQKKRNPRSREWCWTSWEEKFPTEFDEKKVVYVCYQREEGGKFKGLHWQGYAEFTIPISYLSVHKYLNHNNTLHVEQRKGTRQQARDYCRKSDTAIKGSQFEWGEFRNVKQGARTDLDEIGALVKQGTKLRDIAEQFNGQFIRYGRGIDRLQKILFPQRNWKTEVVVFYGKTGTGKSRDARELLPNAYWKTMKDWWDGYEGHEEVVIDEFQSGDMTRKELLMLCDQYPYRVNYKGGSCEFLAKKMIITTNDNPDDWFEQIPELKRRIDLVVEYKEDEKRSF